MDSFRQFSTRTDQRWYGAYAGGLCLALGAAAGVFMWLWLRMLGPAILVGGVFLLMVPVMMLSFSRQRGIPLHFYGNQLQIFHLDGLTYTFQNVPLRVFQFRQNALERKRNVGRIKIKGSQFYLYGVQNFDETRRYIQQNFSDSE